MTPAPWDPRGFALAHDVAITIGCMLLLALLLALRHLVQLGRERWTDWRHHGYYGLVLIVAVPTSWGWWGVACWALGVWMMYDDATNHSLQVEDPTYRSPMHRWYVAAFSWLARRWWARPLVAVLRAIGAD